MAKPSKNLYQYACDSFQALGWDAEERCGHETTPNGMLRCWIVLCGMRLVALRLWNLKRAADNCTRVSRMLIRHIYSQNDLSQLLAKLYTAYIWNSLRIARRAYTGSRPGHQASPNYPPCLEQLENSASCVRRKLDLAIKQVQSIRHASPGFGGGGFWRRAWNLTVNEIAAMDCKPSIVLVLKG